MKYLILRKRYGATENPFTEMVSAEGGRVLGFPFEADTQDLKEHEVGDLKRDPNVEELVPSIFFKLIAPVEESAAAPATRAAWGPDAVGATRCLQNGDGVTVAVLDTGIDSDHPAFQGLSLDATNLKDFVVDERGEA